jgi:hypothetical protein
MTQLSTSAAYVRKNAARDRALRAAGMSGSEIEEVWELLETPQTVVSLQRAAGEKAKIQSGDIEEILERLLDADLIELSPDS